MEKAIDIALRQNPALQSAAYNLKAAGWEVKRSYFNLLPNVDVEFGYNRLDNATVRRANVFYDVGREYFADFPGVDPDDIRPSAWLNSYGTRINVIQPIYNGGANWAGVSMSIASKTQQKHSLDETKQDIIFRVQESYFNVLKAQEMVALMKETLQSTQEHLNTTRRMMEVGLRSRADELRWEVQLADDEGNLITVENQLAIAETALKNVMGVEYEEHFELEPIQGMPRDDIEPIQTLIDTAMDYHPGIQAMESAVDIQRADVRLAWAGFQPKVNFIYSYGWERNNTLALDSFEDWSASVSVDIPIFHSFSEYASLKRAKAHLKSVQQAEEEYRRAVAMQLTNASLNVKSAFKKVTIAQKAVEGAAENLRIIENKYEVGMASNVEVIDVQVAYTGAKVNAINALYDYHIAKADLEKSMGTIGTSDIR
ncbi:MAG: TolC family protein [Gemmatimonadota bacterium]|nr:MAG: TolC family protein [Gemmatimonadota bacterium]